MLSQKHRLNRRNFNEVFQNGIRSGNANLQLIYKKSDAFRASVVVSKKVSKHAVTRHQIKRQVYHILQTLHKEKTITGDLIVFIKKPLLSLSPEVIKKELEHTLETALSKVKRSS